MKASLSLFPRVIPFFLLPLCAFSSGCATVIHGTEQEISIASNPSDATMRVDDGKSYTTPCKVKFARKKDHILVFEKKGYEQQDVVLMHVISGAVAGNIILGGLVGWGVDALNGAQYRLVPESVRVTLRPESTHSVLRPSHNTVQLTVQQRLKTLDELHAQKMVTEPEFQAMRQVILQSATQ